VTGTRVGYAGGATPAPTYQSVCAGDGHSEAVKVTYDAGKISYDTLLDNFFQLHNYRHQNKKQYMSAIFPQNDEQRLAAERHIKNLRGPVATKVLPDAGPFHDAEEYHQHFLDKQRRGIFHR